MHPLLPREQVDSLTEITPAWLAERGLAGLVVDLDNTLVPYGVAPPPPPELAAWKRSFEKSGVPLAIVSNAKPSRTRAWAAALGVPGSSFAAKPLPWSLRRMIVQLGLSPEQVAVAGDQLFTDVLAANLVGAYAVLVEPIEPRKGLPHTRWVRALERRILARRFPKTGVHKR